MLTANRIALQDVRAAIEQYGLLLMQDSKLPSLVSIVAGGPLKGSWWSHPQSKLMFDVLQVISSETLMVKLIAGKRTFVHPRLWAAVCAIAEGNEPWQLDKLKPDTRELLDLVNERGSLRSDQVSLSTGSRKIGSVVDDLEKRLLVHACDEHTERGHHARVLRTWPHWRAEARLIDLPALATARDLIASATAKYHSVPVGNGSEAS